MAKIGMDGKIDSRSEKKHGTRIAKPLLEMRHTVCQVANTDGTVTDNPRQQHNGNTRPKAEHNRHKPRPRCRKRDGHIYHGDEIDQAVRAKRNGKENTEQERPQPTGATVGVLQPMTQPVVVGMMMTPNDEQQHTAKQHTHRQHRLAPLLDKPLHTCRLRPHKEWNGEQNIGGQFAQYEHHAVEQHLFFVANFAVDIADSRNTRKKRTGVEYGEQP